MAVLQQYKDQNGLTNVWRGMYSADPDIAAQGDQARKTQQQGIDAKNARFNQVMPLLQNGLSGAMGGISAGGGQGINVPAPQFGGPHIQGGPLWSEQQIRQNVNANTSSIDRSTATNNRNMTNSLAGRGFGSGSPLAAALENQSNMSAMGQKADYSRQFVPQARQANAQFGLQAAGQQQQQFAQNQNAMLGYGQNLLQNQQNQIRAQGQNQQYASSLLGALGGFLN